MAEQNETRRIFSKLKGLHQYNVWWQPTGSAWLPSLKGPNLGVLVLCYCCFRDEEISPRNKQDSHVQAMKDAVGTGQRGMPALFSLALRWPIPWWRWPGTVWGVTVDPGYKMSQCARKSALLSLASENANSEFAFGKLCWTPVGICS